MMGLLSVATSFIGLLFVMFTLVKKLKRLHKTSYLILGVVAFILRGICLSIITFFYRNAR